MSFDLPMFPQRPRLAIETAEPREVDHGCTRCAFSKGVRTVCMDAEVSQRDARDCLLLVSDYPGNDEDRSGRPMMGNAGKLLRYYVRQHWKGPVVIDNALRCRPGERTIRDTHIKACRGYLAQTFKETRPQRVVVLGSQAISSVLGRSVPPFSARRGYSWLIGPPLVPVFLMMNPAAASRNRFVKEWFEADLKWALTCDLKPMRAQAKATWKGIVHVVRTKQDVEQVVAWAKAQPRWISYDFETAGKLFETGTEQEPPFQALCVSIGSPDDVDAWSWDDKALASKMLLRCLKSILEDPTIKKVGQNEKYDRHCAQQIGIDVRGYFVDTRLMRKIQDPDATASLDVMQELVGMGGGKDEMEHALVEVAKRCKQKPIKSNPDRGSFEDLAQTFGTEKMDLVCAIRRGTEKHKKYSYGLVKKPLLLRYNAIDSRSTALLAEHQLEDIARAPKELRSVWEDLVRPLSLAIGKVEEWGIHTDREALEMFQSTVMLHQQEAMSRIFSLASSLGMPEFNPSKADHVRILLFDKMKLRPTEKTATGLASTSKDVLKDLAAENPIIQDILDWKSVDKKKGTYADPLSAHIRSDGRVHPSIKLDGARSGRPSCEDPNLFNIPRGESQEGKLARDCFTVPGNGLADFEMIQFDYSQLELREAAIESGDPLMRQIFLDGDDYHQRTAEMVSKTAWGIDPAQVEKKHRSEAKSINFGTLYGMGAYTLAARIGCSVEQAEKTQNAIFGRFNKLKRFCDDSVNEALRYGYVWTRWSDKRFRIRPLWRVADKDSESASRAKHGSYNTKIQGKASDRCLFSLVECVRWIQEEKIEHLVKLVLTVYDSLLFEVHKSMINEVLYVVPQLMLQWPSAGVPIVVEAERGPAWGSLEKVGSFSSIPIRKDRKNA